MTDSPTREDFRVYTMGYGELPPASLVSLLRTVGATVVVDSRSYPNTKSHPEYSPGRLMYNLESIGIRYVYMGSRIGGMPQGAPYYDESGHVLYGKLYRSYFFQDALREIEVLALRETVVILCSEEDPSFCHRNELIAPALNVLGFDVFHIRANGEVVPARDFWKGEMPGASVISGEATDPSVWRSSVPVAWRKIQS